MISFSLSSTPNQAPSLSPGYQQLPKAAGDSRMDMTSGHRVWTNGKLKTTSQPKLKFPLLSPKVEQTPGYFQ